jgi:mannose-6-phosphate isomerase-like protein (cupin superfamily)
LWAETKQKEAAVRLDGERYAILSHEENNPAYSDDEGYPEWTILKLFRYYPDQKIGAGVEPHYHDMDEFWLFIDGRGEAWLDGVVHPVNPGTFVFTPRGVLHRFQMFTNFRNCAIATPHVGDKHKKHLVPEVDGPPIKSGEGMVVPAEESRGAIDNPTGRFPLTELRVVRDRSSAANATIDATEYWLSLDGFLKVDVDGVNVRLGTGDLAILRGGARRSVTATDAAVYAFARE